jgi:phage repressor protein C with HTH and peptisase S24 domain
MDYDIQEDYIITPELENRGIKYLIRASGSSMTPKYNNGDLLACRPITDISFMQWGKVYVLDTDQGPIVKRLFECNPPKKGFLECRSDNFEKYPPFKINKESIRRIAIVVGVLRLE